MPPDEPKPLTVAEFRNAARKGLGSAILHLRHHDPRPYYDAVEYICTHNTAYETQGEPSRAKYAFDLIQATKAPDHFRDLVLKTLAESQDGDVSAHAVEIARYFASCGDSSCRTAIYARFDRGDSSERFIGSREIVALDAIAGLLHVVKHLGAAYLTASTNDDDWIASSLTSDAIEQSGYEAVATALAESARNNAAIQAFLDRAELRKQKNAQSRAPAPRENQSITYTELKQKLITSDNFSRISARSWGMRASQADLMLAAQDLLAEQRPDYTLKYLRIFGKRAFPLAPDRLLELLDESDEKISWAAYVALQNVSHPTVRQRALQLLAQDNKRRLGIGLLQSNYQSGDNDLIERALPEDGTDDDLHAFGFAISDVFGANETPEGVSSMRWLYRNTPCAICRGSAVSWLIDHHALTESIRQECLNDSYENTRTLAAQAAPQGQG